jgi:hypothetical protein
MLNKLYVTYIKRKKPTSEVYSGRASGVYDDEKETEVQGGLNILASRDRRHHKNSEGFEPADVDKISKDSDATRGREQMLIESHGGAKSTGGNSGNQINGISLKNENREKYLSAARKLFGSAVILLLILLLNRIL